MLDDSTPTIIKFPKKRRWDDDKENSSRIRGAKRKRPKVGNLSFPEDGEGEAHRV
jgi:hypothetical protein